MTCGYTFLATCHVGSCDNVSFSSDSELKQHFRYKHKVGKGFTCSACGTNYRTWKIFLAHMASEYPNNYNAYHCNITSCGYSSSTKHNMKRHHQTHDKTLNSIITTQPTTAKMGNYNDKSNDSAPCNNSVINGNINNNIIINSNSTFCKQHTNTENNEPNGDERGCVIGGANDLSLKKKKKTKEKRKQQ